jgi:hypothetical protein
VKIPKVKYNSSGFSSFSATFLKPNIFEVTGVVNAKVIEKHFLDGDCRGPTLTAEDCYREYRYSAGRTMACVIATSLTSTDSTAHSLSKV